MADPKPCAICNLRPATAVGWCDECWEAGRDEAATGCSRYDFAEWAAHRAAGSAIEIAALRLDELANGVVALSNRTAIAADHVALGRKAEFIRELAAEVRNLKERSP